MLRAKHVTCTSKHINSISSSKTHNKVCSSDINGPGFVLYVELKQMELHSFNFIVNTFSVRPNFSIHSYLRYSWLESNKRFQQAMYWSFNQLWSLRSLPFRFSIWPPSLLCPTNIAARTHETEQNDIGISCGLLDFIWSTLSFNLLLSTSI
jgi:hypothetical protein